MDPLVYAGPAAFRNVFDFIIRQTSSTYKNGGNSIMRSR